MSKETEGDAVRKHSLQYGYWSEAISITISSAASVLKLHVTRLCDVLRRCRTCTFLPWIYIATENLHRKFYSIIIIYYIYSSYLSLLLTLLARLYNQPAATHVYAETNGKIGALAYVYTETTGRIGKMLLHSRLSLLSIDMDCNRI